MALDDRIEHNIEACFEGCDSAQDVVSRFYYVEEFLDVVFVRNIKKFHVDVVARKKGKWIEVNLKGLDYVYCSECEDTYYPTPIFPNWYFCPHCGADMTEE